MSKRVRGPRRPGNSRPGARPARHEPPAGVRPASGPAEAALPNVLASEAAPVTMAAPARAPLGASRSGPMRQSALAARAATEYVYVGQDLRHIALMAVVIGLILAVLFVLIDVARVIQL